MRPFLRQWCVVMAAFGVALAASGCDVQGNPDAGPDASHLEEDASVPPLAIENLGPHVFVIGQDVFIQLQADGGVPDYEWSQADAATELQGIYFQDEFGRIVGTAGDPTDGARPFVVRLKDSRQVEVEAAVQIDVDPCNQDTRVPCTWNSAESCQVGYRPCVDGAVQDQCLAPDGGAQGSSDLNKCGEGCGACDLERAKSCVDGECACGEEPACGGSDAGCCLGTGGYRCVDYLSDLDNCGGCSQEGTAFKCQANLYTNATVACSQGDCKYTCVAPYDRCQQADPSLDGDCSINTDTNTQHCGECDNACPAPDAGSDTGGIAVCSAGLCGYQCAPDAQLCAGNTCQKRTDPLNCGTCGNQCLDTAPNVATASCSTGACIKTCNEGFENCNNDWSDGCEVNLKADVSNCGGCTGGGQDFTCGSPWSDCEDGLCVETCGTGFNPTQCAEPARCVQCAECPPPPIPCDCCE